MRGRQRQEQQKPQVKIVRLGSIAFQIFHVGVLSGIDRLVSWEGFRLLVSVFEDGGGRRGQG